MRQDDCKSSWWLLRFLSIVLSYIWVSSSWQQVNMWSTYKESFWNEGSACLTTVSDASTGPSFWVGWVCVDDLWVQALSTTHAVLPLSFLTLAQELDRTCFCRALLWPQQEKPISRPDSICSCHLMKVQESMQPHLSLHSHPAHPHRLCYGWYPTTHSVLLTNTWASEQHILVGHRLASSQPLSSGVNPNQRNSRALPAQW